MSCDPWEAVARRLDQQRQVSRRPHLQDSPQAALLQVQVAVLP